MFKKLSKNVTNIAFHDHIWNLHEKCNKISTNMPSFDLVINTIDFLEF